MAKACSLLMLSVFLTFYIDGFSEFDESLFILIDFYQNCVPNL